MSNKLSNIAFVVLPLLIISCTRREFARDIVVKSPDKQIVVTLKIAESGEAYYNVCLGSIEVIRNSRLGILRDDHDFTKNLTLVTTSDVESVSDHYRILHGKRQSGRYKANRKVFRLVNEYDERMNIIFQVSDDGVAFRYQFPDQSTDVKKIVAELSQFNFPQGTTGWLQPMSKAKTGWCHVNPSYEEHYIQDAALESIEAYESGWVFPALFRIGQTWALISETAPDRDYCGCRLQHIDGSSLFRIDFPQPEEVFPGGALNPKATLPWKTPWRIIALGELSTIVESTLGTDLAESARIGDLSWIKPGRASWSWVLLKDDQIVYDVQRRFIDYSAQMGWEYCLIDVNWDQKIGYEKIQELAAYAAERNVGLILWYNSSGDWNTTTYSPKSALLTHEARVEEYQRLTDMGIKGIKVDFFGGDGQSMMAYYQDILEDATNCHLMVNCHGSTLPRGWQRTYPNLVSMEAVRGFEFVTFDQVDADKQPTHSCVLPFTRNVFDPMDFTPVCFSEVPNIERRTSNTFELATAIIFHSGVQHYAEIPEGMAAVPDYIRSIMMEVPVAWVETRFIDGYPGQFIVIAREYDKGWFIAGINGDSAERSLTLDLSFLAGKKGVMIMDGDDHRSFRREEISVVSGKPFPFVLKGNSGFVIQFAE
ncbi:glycoside hydrolase family 97 catalytic domain-containing protein [candidate division KSB1 bacterium]|nr:glycoside hydrolase family 97 catalytic domain-containing protein [candidate division KSB1 bacterium]